MLDQNRTYYKLISSVIDEGQKRGEISDEVSVSDLVDIIPCAKGVGFGLVSE